MIVELRPWIGERTLCQLERDAHFGKANSDRLGIEHLNADRRRKILRIDPRAGGGYGIPSGNPFSGPGRRREIYAYGFRNAHRLSWDLTDGTMYACDIGMNHIEEINIVRNGENYGWMKREGYFQNGRPLGGALNQLYPLPPEILDGRVKDGFTYPVAVYDHDEGRSVTDGFAYHGRIAQLNGKFVFGDIQSGRVFASGSRSGSRGRGGP